MTPPSASFLAQTKSCFNLGHDHGKIRKLQKRLEPMNEFSKALRVPVGNAKAWESSWTTPMGSTRPVQIDLLGWRIGPVKRCLPTEPDRPMGPTQSIRVDSSGSRVGVSLDILTHRWVGWKSWIESMWAKQLIDQSWVNQETYQSESFKMAHWVHGSDGISGEISLTYWWVE